MLALSGRRLLAALFMAAIAVSPGIRAAAQSDGPLVAAASDLQFALPELVAAFEAQTGRQVRVVTGSTGNFARQIRAGAPFQMFMAADEQYVLDLARDGFADDAGSVYALGRIVLIVPMGSPLRADGRLDDLREALADGRVRRFAIANPDHAPYGMRAREALIDAGLWDAVQPVLVLGENVSQAAQFALSGNAQGGIVAYSLAVAPQLAGRARFDLIPADRHAPLVQRMVLLPGAGETARAFFDFVAGRQGQAILSRYGFELPDTAEGG